MVFNSCIHLYVYQYLIKKIIAMAQRKICGCQSGSIHYLRHSIVRIKKGKVVNVKSNLRGSFGKFLAWHHNATMPYKMLSNNTFLETRIQRLLVGINFVEKGLGLQVQRMLKMSRDLYTGGNIKQNTFKKATENWGPYLRPRFNILTIWCQLIFC